jgi:hypothetical protein
MAINNTSLTKIRWLTESNIIAIQKTGLSEKQVCTLRTKF